MSTEKDATSVHDGHATEVSSANSLSTSPIEDEFAPARLEYSAEEEARLVRKRESRHDFTEVFN